MACACASRCILIMFNIIFLIVGLAMAISGGLLAWNYLVIYNILNEQLIPSLQANSSQTAEAIQQILQILAPLGLIIFISGMVILGLCVLGLVGAILFNRCILVLYLTLHGILLVAEIVVVIIYGVQPTLLTDEAKKVLDASVSRYVSISATDADSKLMAALMIGLKCCGSDNGTDFDSSSNFQRTQTYNAVSYTLQYPIPCCKFTSNNQPEATCPAAFTTANSNTAVGCWNVLRSEIDRYSHIILYVAIGIIVLQAILQLASLLLVCSNKDN